VHEGNKGTSMGWQRKNLMAGSFRFVDCPSCLLKEGAKKGGGGDTNSTSVAWGCRYRGLQVPCLSKRRRDRFSRQL
jgi:hypothetical protein